MNFHHLDAAELQRHIANFEADRPNWDADDARTFAQLQESLVFHRTQSNAA